MHTTPQLQCTVHTLMHCTCVHQCASSMSIATTVSVKHWIHVERREGRPSRYGGTPAVSTAVRVQVNTWIRILGLHTLCYHDLSPLPPSVTIAVPEEPDTGKYVVKVTHIFQLSHDDLIAMLCYMCNSMDDVVMVSQ